MTRSLSPAVEAAACISTLRLGPEAATDYLREFAEELGIDFDELAEKVSDEMQGAPDLYLLLAAASRPGRLVAEA